MHITEGYGFSETQPGYRCTSRSKYSDIESTPSVGITSLYQRLFSNTKTRFSAKAVVGVAISELATLCTINCTAARTRKIAEATWRI
ncbi:2929_t:CDS:2 [Diversispora eburnea]|uniref:2929_t:CDS:1 n=1 Tax=Diversispora eburnea TaxID=1213867 RepID=A0A9N9C255_9GLOM|nr:2929_t:CDS:2 [Diversispora eburnea]